MASSPMASANSFRVSSAAGAPSKTPLTAVVMLSLVFCDDQTLDVEVVPSLIVAPAPAMEPSSSLIAATTFDLAVVARDARSPICERVALIAVPIAVTTSLI